jgi:hypothetical protein
VHKPYWLVKKIVSGGQTGVDRAALDWAIERNLPHGGWCPQGRLAEDGTIDLKYELTETQSATYEERTELNVRDSDATAIFTIDPQLKRGSLWTLSCAQKYQKPWIHLILSDDRQLAGAIAQRLSEFLQKYSVRILNIAGSRESEEPAIGGLIAAVLDRF